MGMHPDRLQGKKFSIDQTAFKKFSPQLKKSFGHATNGLEIELPDEAGLIPVMFTRLHIVLNPDNA